MQKTFLVDVELPAFTTSQIQPLTPRADCGFDRNSAHCGKISGIKRSSDLRVCCVGENGAAGVFDGPRTRSGQAFSTFAGKERSEGFRATPDVYSKIFEKSSACRVWKITEHNSYWVTQIALLVGDFRTTVAVSKCRFLAEWKFYVPNVSRPIIGADFICNFGLVIDIRNQCVINSATGESYKGLRP